MTEDNRADRRHYLVLVVDDREDNRTTMAEVVQREGYAVMTAGSGKEAIEVIARHSPDLVITDLQMPDMDGLEVLKTARAAGNPPEVILITAYGTVESAVDAMQHGAFNYLTKPINLKDMRTQINRAMEHRMLTTKVARRETQVNVERKAPDLGRGGFLFESKAMRELMALVERLGDRQSTVLIEGESGVGKEVVAQALHDAMPNAASRPFVAVHCAALPETLLESELFGYEKGAFTGAEKLTLGRIELADGGTLFLDEIGEVPLSMQVKLLRVLEQRELTRVGGRKVIPVSFRLIAATNRRLEERVAQGQFREDLYYRLNVVRLEVPALRVRQEDILPLFEMFLRRFAAEQGAAPATLTPQVENRLLGYGWPGNVRELRNMAERMSIFCSGRSVEFKDLPPNLQAAPAGAAAGGEGGGMGGGMAAAGAGRGGGAGNLVSANTLDLEVIERVTIEKALEQYDGNRSQAAEALGISRRTLQRKLKDYKLAGQDNGDNDTNHDADED